jgi:hypothetical protein
MSLIEHKGLGVSLDVIDITQKDLERYYKRMRESEIKADDLSLPEYSGAVVKTLSDLGFFPKPIVNIDDWKPAAVIFVMTEWSKLVTEAITIPEE